jgi:transcriptional regulator with XRE-family HTH domain
MPVTQEELAEAVGVSRVWYAQLEIGTSKRVSTDLLGRLGDALMLDKAQRATLFQLGIPELARTTLRPSSTAMIDALSQMHCFAKRLWTASTEAEALTIATEGLAECFCDSRLIVSGRRNETGQWLHQALLGDPRIVRRDEAFWGEFCHTHSLREVDAGTLYPLLSQPGDVGTMEAYERTDVKVQIRAALAEHRFGEWEMVIGRVRSRKGFLANLVVKRPSHPYSDTECAMVSTLADVTSLALS